MESITNDGATSAECKRIRRIALGDLLYRSAIRFGTRTAVVDGERRVSYRELDDLSSQFAHYLGETHPLHVHVATLCANSADMVVAIYGIHKAGAVWVPVNIQLSPAQIGYILRHAEVSCVVADEEVCLQPQMAEMLRELDLPVIVTRAESESGEAATIAEVSRGRSTALPDVDIDSDQYSLIMYTSGTTGNPKGVVHSHVSVYSAVVGNLPAVALTEQDIGPASYRFFIVANMHCQHRRWWLCGPHARLPSARGH